MKRIFIMLALGLMSVSAIAQDGLKDTWFVTSQIGYSQTKTADDKSTNVTLLPIVGHFIKDDLALGMAVGMVNVKSESGSTTNANTQLLVIQPLVRKYWGIADKFYFFAQGALPIINGEEKESELKVSQFGLSFSGGFDYFISKNFSVEFSYNLINISQTTLKPKSGEKTTVTDISVAHVANVEPTYNAALGGSFPTLTTPFAFGFKFLF